MSIILSIIRAVFFLLLAIIVVTFILNNNQTVNITMHPLPIESETSVNIVVSISLITGLILGGTIVYFNHIFRLYREKRKLKNIKRENTAMKNEVLALRIEKEMTTKRQIT